VGEQPLVDLTLLGIGAGRATSRRHDRRDAGG
jgi:hypothetical protein